MSDPILKQISSAKKRDIYYLFIESSWPRLFCYLFCIYILSNLFFATLYINEFNSFSDAFFFSVQTMSTIGYGTLAPKSNFANIIVTIEAAFGLIGVALITGLLFSKLAKPHAKIIFSKNMIISDFNGKTTLSFRIGNARGNDIIQANIDISALIHEKTKEGNKFVRIYDLKLERNKTPFFKLTWSSFHSIDESSPLHNIDIHGDKLKAIAVTVTGHDGTYSNTIYSRYNYLPEDIVKDKYFMDIMHEESDGSFTIDYSNFNTLT